jgi:hypothetical protein
VNREADISDEEIEVGQMGGSITSTTEETMLSTAAFYTIFTA